MRTTALPSVFSFTIFAVIALFFLIPSAHASVMVYDGGEPYVYVVPDSQANGGINNPQHSGISSEMPSMQRACYLADPTAYPSYWRSGQYDSPGDNSVIHWGIADAKSGGSPVWYRTGAKHNQHIKELDCSTDAKADTSLTASKTQIVKGDSSTLTWNSQYAKVRKATCTATNFTLDTFVPAHFETVVWDGNCGGGGGGLNPPTHANSAAGVCGVPLVYQQWVPDYTGSAPFGGAKDVSPQETTTYTYSCTNANGTESSSVTVTVLDEPDPSCSDGLDNNGNGPIDGSDPDCGTGGTGTEVPHANLPDVVADDVNEDLVPSGTPTTLSALISNVGDAPTGVGFKNLFQIDNDNDHANVFAVTTGTSPALFQDGTDVSKATYTFPSAGTWYVRACGDNDASWHGTVNESNENNNCSTGGWKEVTVAADVPTASLWASPPSVASNEASTLSWECTKSTSASIDNGIGSVTPVDGGTISTGPLLSKTDYTLTCTGDKGSAKSFYSVLVNPPTVDIHADPPLVKKGGQTIILWESHGATSCLVTGPGIIASLAHLKIGSLTTTINNQSTYSISCNGVATKSITVGIVPEFNEK